MKIEMMKGLFALVTMVLLLQSCQEKMICPAYQSTFILDDEERYQLFTRFEKDSIPKNFAGVNKSSYGIIEPMGRKKRERQMATVAMRTIMPVLVEDTLTTSATDITPLRREISRK